MRREARRGSGVGGAAAEPPTLLDQPDEFRVRSVMVTGVAMCFAHTICDKANLDAVAAGMRERWAVVVPPGFITRFLEHAA